MIVKSRFLCKTTFQTGSFGRGGALPMKGPASHPEVDWVAASIPNIWTPKFTSGKWYDGEYEDWSDEMYRLNAGWSRYWVVDEQGKKEEIGRTYMRIIFELDDSKIRDKKIDDILGDENLQKDESQ